MQGDEDLDTTETITLQFSSPNITRLCTSLSVVNDTTVEDLEEQFSLTLNSSDPAVIISSGVAFATITDDDCMSHPLNATNSALTVVLSHRPDISAGFEFESYFIRQGNSDVSVCVVYDGTLDRNATVSMAGTHTVWLWTQLD